MDNGVVGFLSFVFIFVVLDVAAVCFGVDSRRLTPELPVPGDPVSGATLRFLASDLVDPPASSFPDKDQPHHLLLGTLRGCLSAM